MIYVLLAFSLERDLRERKQMAISITTCSFKISSPRPPSSTPLPSNASKTQLARPKTEFSLRNQCVIGLTCAIISLQTVNLIGNEETAIAASPNMQSIAATSKEKVKRWSEKRTCQPWQLNSLETIVPENLPRPSFHRKLEAAGFSKTAPAIKVSIAGISCFSM